MNLPFSNANMSGMRVALSLPDSSSANVLFSLFKRKLAGFSHQLCGFALPAFHRNQCCSGSFPFDSAVKRIELNLKNICLISAILRPQRTRPHIFSCTDLSHLQESPEKDGEIPSSIHTGLREQELARTLPRSRGNNALLKFNVDDIAFVRRLHLNTDLRSTTLINLLNPNSICRMGVRSVWPPGWFGSGDALPLAVPNGI